METLQNFKNTNLPSIQRRLIDTCNSVDDVVNFDQLHLVLNVCFTGYAPLIGFAGKDSDGLDIPITDKKNIQPNGSQTKEMEDNAYLFAHALKKEFIALGAARTIPSSKKYFIDGVQIKGMRL